MALATLITKDEVLSYLAFAKLGFASSDIADEAMSQMRVDTRTWLERSPLFEYDKTIEEHYDFTAKGYIWCGSFCLLLEQCSMLGLVEQSSGDVQTVKIGDMQTTFQRWQPMFFFAKGMAQGFYELLPHMTYNMKAMQMLRSWKEWMFKKTRPKQTQYGTSFGYWDGNNKTDKYGMGSGIDYF